MSNTPEDFKGRAKEAAGAVTGNDKLKHEGQADQASAKIKDRVEDVVDKVEEVFEKAKGKISGGSDHR